MGCARVQCGEGRRGNFTVEKDDKQHLSQVFKGRKPLKLKSLVKVVLKGRETVEMGCRHLLQLVKVQKKCLMAVM